MNVLVKDLIRVFRLGDVEVQALRGLSMEVNEGEMVSVIGPSGSGKTTLLNIVGGLDQATAGYVQVGDVTVTALQPSQLVDFRRKHVGHIFQTLNLIPTLSAAENVELPMMAIGTSRRSRHERVKHLLEIVGLTERASHKPDELSGGEQQRVAFARALANNPPLILADEPTGNLDIKTGLEIVHIIAKMKVEGKTVIVATHDTRILELANRRLQLHEGRIIESDE